MKHKCYYQEHLIIIKHPTINTLQDKNHTFSPVHSHIEVPSHFVRQKSLEYISGCILKSTKLEQKTLLDLCFDSPQCWER